MNILKLFPGFFISLLCFNYSCISNSIRSIPAKDDNSTNSSAPSINTIDISSSGTISNNTNVIPSSIQPTDNQTHYDYTVRVSGKIYDINKEIITDATVVIKSQDSSMRHDLLYKEYKSDGSGSYIFNNITNGAEVIISVFKDGYKSVERTETINTQVQPLEAVLNFGGDGEDAKYALEKINP